MKTNLLTLNVLSATLFLYSCDMHDHHVVPGSNITTAQATFSDYNGIDASTAFNVYITFSDDEESIEIEANDNLHQHIEVKKQNGILLIGIEDNVHVRGNATLNAYITTKDLSSFSASGASRIIVEDPIEKNNVNIHLSGASNFYGYLHVNQLYSDLSGASILDIDGFSDYFELDASGASVLRSYVFTTNKFKADLSGASNAYLTVEEEIDVEASGASSLMFKGKAVITHQDLSGASTVKKM